MSINNIQEDKVDNLKINYEILSENVPNYDFSYKIIIVGNPGNLISYNK
jgi:hypothetical protein